MLLGVHIKLCIAAGESNLFFLVESSCQAVKVATGLLVRVI